MKLEPAKRSTLESLLIDGSVLVGGGMLAYGAWLTFQPAGFIVGGMLLLSFGVVGARR